MSDQMNRGICVSTDKSLLDIPYIHGVLKGLYWAKNIPMELVVKSIENSLPFGVYKEQQQIGFARVITDFTVFAYLADVFIDEREQGKGYGSLLLDSIFNHPELLGMRRWHLLTDDAHPLYRKFGFHPPVNPGKHLEKTQKPDYLTS